MKNTAFPKVLIIGIDGATFSLITPWAEAGKLPHFRRLMEGGAWGTLNSSIPPITPAAWTSFMTGNNPGKHGIFDFLSPKKGSYDFSYNNASARRSKTIWRIFSDNGFKVGVVNVPMTFPPEHINGFMISGLDTPDEDSEFIYPSSLRDELKHGFGEVRLDITHLEFMRSDSKRDTVLKEIAALEDSRCSLAIHLMKKYPVDVFMVVFCSVDQIQHYFWHYMDRGHFRHDPKGAEKYGDAILNAYKKMDDKIGEILSIVPEDTTVVLMSDHGAGPSSDNVVYLNKYLSHIGALEFEKGRSSLCLDTVTKVFDPILRSSLSHRQKAKIAKYFPGLRGKWEKSLSSLTAINWTKTKAFCYEAMPTYAYIWINLEGRFPLGVVKGGADYNRLLDYLTAKLYDMKDPVNGRGLIKSIFRKGEVYTGPCTEEAPDLILSWWDDNGFTLRPGSQADGEVFVRKLDNSIDKFVNWSGTHRPEGIFLLSGRPFRNARINDSMDIVDLAPTLLFLMGCPVPGYMDGKVIERAFREEYLRANTIRYSKDQDDSDNVKRGTGTYSEEDEDVIAKRLKSLGYME